MEWQRILSYITGSIDEDLRVRNELSLPKTPRTSDRRRPGQHTDHGTRVGVVLRTAGGISSKLVATTVVAE